MLYPFIKEAGLVWMMPIIAISFCALAFCLERSWFWLVHVSHSWGRSEVLRKIFQTPWRLEEARRWCQNSHDTAILALQEFMLQYDNVSLAIAERKARQFAELKVAESRRFLDVLALIVNISGTLGLMGTVVGISLSFKTMAKEDSRGLASSLSTAMYTTIGGIILFLLSYLFLFFFQKFSDHLENILEANIQELRDLLEIREKSAMVFENNVLPVSEFASIEKSSNEEINVDPPPFSELECEENRYEQNKLQQDEK